VKPEVYLVFVRGSLVVREGLRSVQNPAYVVPKARLESGLYFHFDKRKKEDNNPFITQYKNRGKGGNTMRLISFFFARQWKDLFSYGRFIPVVWGESMNKFRRKFLTLWKICRRWIKNGRCSFK
jgi:hypothetical protein